MKLVIFALLSVTIFTFLSCQDSEEAKLEVKEKSAEKVEVEKVSVEKNSTLSVDKEAVSVVPASTPKPKPVVVLAEINASDTMSKELVREDYVDINVTKAYVVPADALFLDIRNAWERHVYGGYPAGSHGVTYEFRKEHAKGVAEDRSKRVLNEHFVEEVITMAAGDKNIPIILICATGSRTGAEGNRSKESAAKLLISHGFTHVSHIRAGIWGEGGWSSADLPWVQQ